MPPRAAPAKSGPGGLPPKNKDNFGKVPKYLEKFKEEAKEKSDVIEAKKAAKMAGCPPGTKLMPEEERLQTLADLEDNKKNVNAMLMKMPISMQSLNL